MTDARIEWISKRAYTLWEEAGRPHGQDEEHWSQAVREREEFERVALPAGTPARVKKKPLIEISGKTETKKAGAAKTGKSAQTGMEKPASAKVKAVKAANSKPI